MDMRDVRERAGLTQQALASAAGISRTTLTLIESGVTTEPETETVEALAAALHTTPDRIQVAIARTSPIPTLPPNVWLLRASTASSWQEFRHSVETTLTRFAAVIGVARETVRGFEAGHRRHTGQALPPTIRAGIVAYLSLDENLSPSDIEYAVNRLAALPLTPPSTPPSTPSAPHGPEDAA